jgi:uncharacterized repeat protein (TIGR01451 family)
MKTITQNRARNIGRAALITTALSFAMANNAMAAQVGTPSNTTISNTATLSFTAGGVDQTPIDSNTSAFVVGSKINLTLIEDNSTFTTIVAGATLQATSFTLTNLGNDSQSYNLTAADLVNGTALFTGIDNFDLAPGTFAYYIDVDNSGSWDAGDTPIPLVGGFYTVPALASGDSLELLVTATIPADRVNGDQSVISLTAATTDAGTSTLVVETGTGVAFDPLVVQIVFADVGFNASETALDAYRLITATLTVTKTAAVYWDPSSLYVNPKAIPGAIVTYTISIVNNGNADATLASIADDLAGKPVTFNPQYLNGVGGATTCSSTQGILISTVCSSNTADSDDADYTGTIVTGKFATIAVGAGASVTMSFQVTVD